ncbi:MAG: hypothetical protein IPM39_20990 [Chloroflexi bacterium]|nr:hypothetical protein [Chloroflexota bacterium]
MWRWITLVVILILAGRPIILVNNPACDKAGGETAVSPPAPNAIPCHDSVRLVEANTSGAPHSCPCPAIWPPTAEGWVAAPFMISSWFLSVHLPQTAVTSPLVPPPRSL